MSKQDRQGVRTATDLERKYDLASLVGIKKAVENNVEGLNKTNKTLEEFVIATTGSIEELKEQIDGNITTWFYSGVPTLSNLPASEWTTDVLKNEHLGDLYYDDTTGYAYRFALCEGVYKWIELADSDVAEALALANEAKDTADGKRRVFVVTPTVPYDVGDLWLNNEELYVCNVAKTASEKYVVEDWGKATKYTDDSALTNFIKGDYADDLAEIETQIDKKAETWYQDSDPSTSWTTATLKALHVGDLWFNTNTKKSYIYSSSYAWSEADGVPDSVYDKIDGKAQIFTSQPTVPYYVGDLYVQGTSGDILVCKTERTTGSYTASEWGKASKYTDDTNLNNFVNIPYADSMKSLNDLIDSKITTWYYSGVPTLSNLPASEWKTNDEKQSHIGDLYYDKATGYTYRFDATFTWEQIIDKDLTEALALANAASDTADSKRRIFTSTPFTPYDNGDLRFKDQEIYISQISKDEKETFAENDFIVATKYTDDTLAKQVGDNLEVVRGTVTTIQTGVDAFKIDIETTVKSIDSLQQETIESMERMSYTFGTHDLSIAKSTDPVNTRINNQGLKVFTYNDLQAIFNHRGAGIQKLIVVGDAQLGNISIAKSIDKNGNACTDINYLVSNVQDLSDLEGD